MTAWTVGGKATPPSAAFRASRRFQLSKIGLTEDGVDPNLARSLAEHLTDEIEHSVATKDHVDTVVTREVQGLRVEMTQQIQNLRAELSDKLTLQFRWLLGWLAVVTVGIPLDLLR